jgi:hypothetical protein
MKFAIDVSRYDAVQADGTLQPLDWRRARLDLAIIKASEGMRADPAFACQWQAAAGLPRVAYHFFRSNVEAAAQAQFFSSLLEDLSPFDRLAVDFETLDGMRPTYALNSLAVFLIGIGKKHAPPLIYTYPGFWQTFDPALTAWAAKYPLWLAQWPRDTWILGYPLKVFDASGLAGLKAEIVAGSLGPVELKPWSGPAIWQFTARADTRAVTGYSGIKKVCDYNAVLSDWVPAAPARICPLCGGSGKVEA